MRKIYFLNNDYFKDTLEGQTFCNTCFLAPPDLNYFPQHLLSKNNFSIVETEC